MRRLLVDVQDVSLLRPGGVCVLSSINLVVREQESIGVVGRNGAGKTTLLRLLAGVLPPTTGWITWGTKPYALLSGGSPIQERLTGWRNLELLLLLSGVDTKQQHETLERAASLTQLGSALERPVSSYSSGMKTRLNLSAILAVQPSLMLIDEGIGAGDAIYRDQVANEIESMLQNSSVVMASHSPALLREFCDSAIFMDKGEVKFRGGVDECFEKLKTSGQQP